MLKEILHILLILAILALAVMAYREMWYVQFSEENLEAILKNLPGHRLIK